MMHITDQSKTYSDGKHLSALFKHIRHIYKQYNRSYLTQILSSGWLEWNENKNKIVVGGGREE